MSKWIKCNERKPEYIKHRKMLTAPMVIIKFRGDKGWIKNSGRPKGIDVGTFTVHTKEWRRHGYNYACKATHWMPLPDGPKKGIK